MTDDHKIQQQQVNWGALKLGRNPSPPDDRNLKLCDYLTPALPTPPPAVDWLEKVTFPAGEMLNDQLGCCTCAGMGHAEQSWTANNGAEVTIPDADILALYEAACGFDPSDPQGTDRGGDLLTVAKYVRAHGVGGHKLDAFVQVDLANLAEVQTAIWLFGGLYCGLNMPVSVMRATQAAVKAGQPIVWKAPTVFDESAGGHCVYLGAYDGEGFDLVSWGFRVRADLAFWQACAEEALALVSPEWCGAGKSPAGFDLPTLLADVKELSA